MTSLEFIEKEIVMVKKKISMAKSKFTIKNITYEQYKEIEEEIKTLKGRLIHLQQIKFILELFNILKPQLDLEYEDGEDDKFMIGMRHYVGLETNQAKQFKEVLNNE